MDEPVKSQEELEQERIQSIIDATAKELSEWRSQPTTKRFFAYLKAFRLLEMQAMIQGQGSTNDINTNALMNAESVAKARMIQDILELDAINLLTTERDVQNAEYFRL